MSWSDEILKENDEKERAIAEAIRRKQNERKSAYQDEIQKATLGITDCILNAFKNARISENYTIKGRFHKWTINRKNVAIRMTFDLKLHEQYQEPILFRAEYNSYGDDYDTWESFDRYALYADIHAYTLIMNGVIEKLESEKVAECVVEEIDDVRCTDGFQYIKVIKELASTWKRVDEEEIQRTWGNDIIERRRKDKNHWTTISMMLFFS